MGFMWSSPITPLRERLLVETELEPVHTGDLILLGEYSEEMVEDFPPWTRVGIVFLQNQVYDGVQVYSLREFVRDINEIKIRYYEGVRGYGFDKRLQNAVRQTKIQLLTCIDGTTRDDAYGVAQVLVRMRLIKEHNLDNVEPSHFSHSLSQLPLNCYSENKIW